MKMELNGIRLRAAFVSTPVIVGHIKSITLSDEERSIAVIIVKGEDAHKLIAETPFGNIIGAKTTIAIGRGESIITLDCKVKLPEKITPGHTRDLHEGETILELQFDRLEKDDVIFVSQMSIRALR